MSFIIEQKIKGNIYLYRVESQWDKAKKRTIQKRTYIGPKYPKNKKSRLQKGLDLVNKSYGDVIFLEQLAKRIGIYQIVQSCFPTNFKEILALSFYEIIEGHPFYLFPYWQDEHYLPEIKKLDSSSISSLFGMLGKKEKQRLNCLENWIKHLQPLKGLYFDISSISSYSNEISLIEWGYNRDKEALAQLNIGMVFCEEKRLPINYQLYPGSIVDVTTLKNCQKYLQAYGLQDFLFVLDRGFFSVANVLTMERTADKIKFIQPLPFRLKKAKQLVKKYKRAIQKIGTSFKCKQQVINYLESEITFDKTTFKAHLFYNEKMDVHLKHKLLTVLFELEEQLVDCTFETLKKWTDYREENVGKKYWTFLKWNSTTKKIEKNLRTIQAHTNLAAYFIFLTNLEQISPQQLFYHYYNKDLVEKVFYTLKNEIDAKRLRVHNDYTMQGKLFVLFLALTIHSEIKRVMDLKEMFKKFTVKELLYELKKIKINYLPKDGKPIISEISKTQKMILKKFDFKIFHGY